MPWQPSTLPEVVKLSSGSRDYQTSMRFKMVVAMMAAVLSIRLRAPAEANYEPYEPTSWDRLGGSPAPSNSDYKG